MLARNGMAATSQPLATAAAIRILQGGGNAIDAAIAFKAVLGMDVQSAVDAPRWRHLGSSEPTGEKAKGGGSVALESGNSNEVRRALEAKGQMLVTSRGGFGGD